ncbi:MAG: thiamine phosphate synthase [Thermodesulfovibrionales bacterium]|nr:thiamine phosphate synthase [Thermodesulfovibrionales bacterium]
MIALESEMKTATAYQPIDLDFHVYLVTNRKIHPGMNLLEATEQAVKGGVRAIQLREKDLKTRDLLRVAYELRSLTLKADARLFINDRVDIAIAIEADGVQLGQKSIPPYAVRRIASRLIIGVSCHSMEEAMRAQSQGADFITLGPVYPTISKPGMKPLGMDTLETVARKLSIPVFGIGGITNENIKEVIDRGAFGGALISGIFGAKDIKQAALKTLKVLK